VERLAIEQALAGALAALSAPTPLTVCATTGHGELPLLTKDPKSADWSLVADRLRGEGISLEEIALSSEVPPSCRVVVVAGPSTPLPPTSALALQRFLAAGGGLLVAAPSRNLATGLGATGLESLLAADGLGLPPAIAVDPTTTVRELPGTLLIVDGYADHPINAGFPRTRATLWFQPRPVSTAAGARPLVSATPSSWGETDLISPPEKHEQDLAGPISLAALGSKHAVIAIGSAESFSTALLSSGASAADLWLARALRFLGGATDPRVDVAARTPDQIRLLLTSGERSLIIALSVAGIPLAWMLLGGGLVWWRRRRGAAP
jgi:hypothetical protein